MKRHYKRIEKLWFMWRAFIYFYFDIKLQEGLVEFCPYCTGTQFDKVHIYDDADGKREKGSYEAKYICKKCGSWALVFEDWNKGIEVQE